MRVRLVEALHFSSAGFEARLGALIETALACHFEAPGLAMILEREEARLGPAAEPVLAGSEAEMSRIIRKFVLAHAGEQDEEADRIADRMEIVGRALIDDALRRSEHSAAIAAEIAAITRACAPSGFWVASPGGN